MSIDLSIFYIHNVLSITKITFSVSDKGTTNLKKQCSVQPFAHDLSVR